MDPQMMTALGMGGGAGASPLMAMLKAKMMQGGAPGMPPVGAPPGGAPIPPVMPGAAPTAPAAPSAAPFGMPGGGGGSSPGLMPGPSGQTTPGSNPPLPQMAGDSARPTAAQEPTGENPQRPQPHNTLPHFPRNRFGAMLLPKGGQIAQQGAPPPGPAGAFNYNNLLGSFLQPRGTVGMGQ